MHAAFARAAQDAGPFAVEIDQFRGDGLALGRIGVEQRGWAAAAQHRGKLPAEIERVLHGNVHALSGLRAVGVAGIAGDEDARQTRFDFGLRHVVELVGQALADLVDRPPGDFLRLEAIGRKDPLGGGDEIVGGDVAALDPLAFALACRSRHKVGRDSRPRAGIRTMLPSDCDWISPFMRMSGKSVTARTSITPQAELAESPFSSRPSDPRTALRAPSQPTT